MKYHLNPTSGEPGQCRAKRSCPFGDSSAHYASPEEARSAYEALEALRADLLAEGRFPAWEVSKWDTQDLQAVLAAARACVTDLDLRPSPWAAKSAASLARHLENLVQRNGRFTAERSADHAELRAILTELPRATLEELRDLPRRNYSREFVSGAARDELAALPHRETFRRLQAMGFKKSGHGSFYALPGREETFFVLSNGDLALTKGGGIPRRGYPTFTAPQALREGLRQKKLADRSANS